MAQPYVGEIRMFAGNFAPAGWMFCEGQLLPISEYETLFNLIGTTYGGDGQRPSHCRTCAARLPIHFGNGFTLRGDRRRGDGHPDRQADTGTHASRSWRARDIANHSSSVTNVARSTLRRDRSISRTAGTVRSIRRRSGSTGGSQPHDNYPALSLHQFHHLALRHLPISDVMPRNRSPCMDPFVAEIRIFPFNFAPEGLGVLRRAAPAALPEHRPLLAARHDLRRRRQEQLRLAEYAGQCADAPAPGPRPFAARSRRNRRHRYRTLLESEIPSHITPSWRSVNPAHDTPALAERLARAVARRQCLPYRPPRQLPRWRTSTVATGGKRSAAQQSDALPDAELLHRAPRSLPAALLTGGYLSCRLDGIVLRPQTDADRDFLRSALRQHPRR